MSLLRTLGVQYKKPSDSYRGYDPKKPSLGVVASDGNGNGLLLWYVGVDLALEVEEYGFRFLTDLGLDDAPAGVSVWEGKYVWDGDDANPKGRFRPPTEAEWVAIREGRMPWDPKEWKLKP